MTLTKSDQYNLKAAAHALKPTVLLGAKGLTAAVINEIDQTLSSHELIKIKLTGVNKEDKSPLLTNICSQLNAELIQLQGHIATIYRKNKEQIA